MKHKIQLEGFKTLEHEEGYYFLLGLAGLYSITLDDNIWNVEYIYGEPEPREKRVFKSEDEAILDVYNTDVRRRARKII